MGQRRENRLPKLRTDLQILGSPDMDLLRAVEAGQVIRMRAGASPVFMYGEVPVSLRRLEDEALRRLEDEALCTSPIGGLPVLQPRGRRLLQVVRGELPRPLPE